MFLKKLAHGLETVVGGVKTFKDEEFEGLEKLFKNEVKVFQNVEKQVQSHWNSLTHASDGLKSTLNELGQVLSSDPLAVHIEKAKEIIAKYDAGVIEAKSHYEEKNQSFKVLRDELNKTNNLINSRSDAKMNYEKAKSSVEKVSNSEDKSKLPFEKEKLVIAEKQFVEFGNNCKTQVVKFINSTPASYDELLAVLFLSTAELSQTLSTAFGELAKIGKNLQEHSKNFQRTDKAIMTKMTVEMLK